MTNKKPILPQALPLQPGETHERPDDKSAHATATGVQPQPGSGPGEIGGPAGPEPTRYGDWEVNGRCSDF